MATRKEAPKTQDPAKTPDQRKYDAIPEDIKRWLAEDIMSFEDADICPDGRERFLRRYGFPIPDPLVAVTFTVFVRLPSEAFRDSLGIKKVDTTSTAVELFETRLAETVAGVEGVKEVLTGTFEWDTHLDDYR